MVTDLTLFEVTSSMNCENAGCDSCGDLVCRTTVHNNTTTMMMTTQNTAVLTFEFIPSPTIGNTSRGQYQHDARSPSFCWTFYARRPIHRPPGYSSRIRKIACVDAAGANSRAGPNLLDQTMVPLAVRTGQLRRSHKGTRAS